MYRSYIPKKPRNPKDFKFSYTRTFLEHAVTLKIYRAHQLRFGPIEKVRIKAIVKGLEEGCVLNQDILLEIKDEMRLKVPLENVKFRKNGWIYDLSALEIFERYPTLLDFRGFNAMVQDL